MSLFVAQKEFLAPDRNFAANDVFQGFEHPLVSIIDRFTQSWKICAQQMSHKPLRNEPRALHTSDKKPGALASTSLTGRIRNAD